MFLGKTYQEFGPSLVADSIVVLRGRVNVRDDGKALHAVSMFQPNVGDAMGSGPLTLSLPERQATTTTVTELAAVLGRHTGRHRGAAAAAQGRRRAHLRDAVPGEPDGRPVRRAEEPARPALPGVGASTMAGHRIFGTPVADVYGHYLAKVERKGHTKAELDTVIEWLTGFDDLALAQHLADRTTFEDFFAGAHLNPNAPLITGVICGVRIEELDDPLMRQIRYLDKLVDEVAKGRPMVKILRTA